MDRWLLCLLPLVACSPQPAPAPQPTSSPAGTIPAALQGRYGVTPGACTATDARGLLTIGGDALAFGVTPLTVDRVALLGDRAVFDTTATSAGVAESRRYAFRRSPDGRTLTRIDFNRPDQVYTRCPERPS